LDQICGYLGCERYAAGGVWVDRFESEQLIVIVDYHEAKGRYRLLRGATVVATDLYLSAHERGKRVEREPV
jgi:hypothetical protein